MRRLGFGLALLILAGALAAGAAAPPTVRTAGGQAAGVSRSGADAFLGLPFAAPPVGELRWAAPQPPKPWTGVRPARASAVPCSAPANGDGPRYVNEDCLYLDLYRPAATRPGAKLPVMVFIHGGAHLWGSTRIYDGARMARVGKALVVLPAYRLGVFGALAAPEAGRAGGGYEIQDLVAALAWVKANAAAFGGDPGDVTIFGQSAGASNVCALLAAPGARGLYHRAIIESGGCSRPKLAEAQAEARRFAAKLGCPEAALACLRAKDAGALLDAWAGPGAAPAGTAALPEDPAAVVAEGRQPRTPLLIGFTRDERWPYQHGLYPLSEAGYRAELDKRYGARAAAVAARYPTKDFPHIEYALGATVGDSGTICSSLRTAEAAARHVPVSLYEFADRTTPAFKSLGPPQAVPPGYSPGAFHTSELQFLMGYKAAARPLDAAQLKRADEMIRRWVGFGRGVAWPSAPGGAVRFDDKGASPVAWAALQADHRCDLWSQAPRVG